uniref:transposase n=1 Tax=Nitrosomonas supralitoralis TaxID=2116706 RepID=UPI0035A872A7
MTATVKDIGGCQIIVWRQLSWPLREVNGTQIILPGKALKKDSRYQKDKKRKQCRRRAAIEPIIGHLKSDCRMARNYLKGALGDHINLLLAAVAWNLKQWLLAIVWLFFPWRKLQVSRIL